ncbi:MAG: RNA polymerase sigma factor SigJ [Streptosporangiaceae bacterium]
MKDQVFQAEQFERHRTRLRAVAYRMLGSASEAEDAVQEAWLRLSQSDDEAIANLGGWLTTVVGRVCLDMLRARRSRHECYIGSWEPEPADDALNDAGPEQQTVLADSVGLALMVVLETLNPAERLAFVLHDMFAVPFEEIAPLVDRTPAATRQLASRARRRVRGSDPVEPDLPRKRKVVTAFLAAARAGDFDALVAVLDPGVVFRSDTGQRPWLAPALLTGATDVARHTVTTGPRFASLCRPALVNGAPAIVVPAPAGPLGVARLAITEDRIVAIDLILDPARLGMFVVDD